MSIKKWMLVLAVAIGVGCGAYGQYQWLSRLELRLAHLEEEREIMAGQIATLLYQSQ